MYNMNQEIDMSWYRKHIESMALEPGAWQGDANPHRLQRHHEVVSAPWGKVKQRVDPQELQSVYTGVHLTNSFELAAAYANSKSNSDQDPPVVIELYDEDFDKLPDADANEIRLDIQNIMGEKRSEFGLIISGKSSDEEKVEHIIQDLTTDIEMSEFRGDSSDPSDIIFEKERPLAERAIILYLEKMSDYKQVIMAIQSMIDGNIPDEVLISAANQYRVMYPIGHEKVHAIYSIVRTNLEDYTNIYQLEQLSDEDLEEEGITKSGNEFFDSRGRKLVDIESVENGWWIEKSLLYQDPHAPSRTDNFTYHGTSLSRAKQAYPNLL